MPAFRISKDRVGVLRLQRRAYPLMSLQEQETFELSGAVYGYLVQRNESLDAAQFLARIHAFSQSNDPRQFEIERVIGLCMERQQTDQKSDQISDQKSDQISDLPQAIQAIQATESPSIASRLAAVAPTSLMHMLAVADLVDELAEAQISRLAATQTGFAATEPVQR